MPMRREVTRGGRFGAGRLRMSCTFRVSSVETLLATSLRRALLELGTCSVCGADRSNGRLEERLLLQPRVEFRSTGGPFGFAQGRLRGPISTFFVPQGELMLVVMKAQATEEQVRAVCEKIE